MQRKIYKIIVYTLIFIAFSTFMPNFTIANGPFAKILVGVGYSLVYLIIGDVLHFFKLPQTTTFKIAGGLILVSTYLFVLANQFPSFLKLGKGFIGGVDCIIFTIPRIATFDTPLMMILASAIILLLCSIIMDKLKK